MPRFAPLLLVLCAATLAAPSLAADRPPANGKPLSEIVRAMEQRDDFSYFDEIEWDEDGYWEVEYFTKDGAKRELRIDPVSGEARPR